MDPADKSPTIIVHEDSDSLEELSEYLDVLSSSARLRILKFLEKRPRDARGISKEIETSYENTKKHLDKLLSIGVIKKRVLAPLRRRGSTRSGNTPLSRAVWRRSYGISASSQIRGFRWSAARSPRRLDEVKGTLSREVLGNIPAAIALGGPDDGKIFLLKNDIVNIGRNDPENVTAFRPESDVVLADGYTAVTRVSRPHGKFVREKGTWHIEDCGSTGLPSRITGNLRRMSGSRFMTATSSSWQRVYRE